MATFFYSTEAKISTPQVNIHTPAGEVKKPITDSKTTKLSFKEQKELEGIPTKIEQLENEQADIRTKLANIELYKTQPQLVKTLQLRLKESDNLLENLLTHLEKLDARTK